MITRICSNDPWTGTRGRQPEVIVIRSPEKECDLAIRAAQDAINFLMREFNPEEVGELTVKECIELRLDL